LADYASVIRQYACRPSVTSNSPFRRRHAQMQSTKLLGTKSRRRG